MQVCKEQFDLKSRRYMGNKTKLTGFIKDIVRENCGHVKSFCDLFAGTGAVAHSFNQPEISVIANDHLLSNYYALKTFLVHDDSYIDMLDKRIDDLNKLELSTKNYFSVRYGGTFFTKRNARKIGTIRDRIEKDVKDNKREILITSLIYAMDRVANTVGHYDAYMRKMDNTKSMKLFCPKLQSKDMNHNNIVRNEDANKLVRSIKSDVLYLDPPYNSRHYCDAYHLLENVAQWNKPKTYGKAQKMDRSNLKSKYCLKEAVAAFHDLIMNSKSKYIVLSYNNTGHSRDARSNARISDIDIKRILKKKGNVHEFECKYKEFTAGKSSSVVDHTERLFCCKVK